MPKVLTVTRYEADDGTLHVTQESAAMHNIEMGIKTAYILDPIHTSVPDEALFRWLVRNRGAVETMYKGLDKVQ